MFSFSKGYGLILQSVSLFLFFLLTTPLTAETKPYLAELQHRAQTNALHQDPYWHILLHYERGPFGLRSNVDDPTFFCAPNGKRDPASELSATLAAFFQEATDKDLEHPICRFVARFMWLRERLDIDVTQLPMQACASYHQVLTNMDVTSATLIFPSAHMNRPASMFGHTALVFDTGNRNRLLAKAVNYAASTTEGFGPFFAFAGIAGLYKGYYSIDTYADKVELFNDIDQRDVWEYELNLTSEEIDRMLRHVWELQTTYSQYYFFTENCAYNLLYLIEAARPSAELTDKFSWWVLPIDTVKAVQDAGLVRDRTYRPSKTTTLKHLGSQLSTEDLQSTLALAHGKAMPDDLADQETDVDRTIVVLDLAAEYCQYLYATGALAPKDYRPRFMRLLRSRSKLTGSHDSYRAPEPEPPEEGHDAGRIALGIGVIEQEAFLSLQWRPAHHELTDTPKGFDLGSHIQFAPVVGRYLFAENRVELQQADMVDIVSLAPRNRLFRPSSWTFRTGVRQVKFHGTDDNLLYYVNTGTGHAYQTWLGMLAGMIETDILAGGQLDHSYAAGIGFSTYWLSKSVGRWHNVMHARAMTYPLGHDFFSYRLAYSQSVSLRKNQSMTLALSHEVNDNHTVQQVEFACRFYF